MPRYSGTSHPVTPVHLVMILLGRACFDHAQNAVNEQDCQKPLLFSTYLCILEEMLSFDEHHLLCDRYVDPPDEHAPGLPLLSFLVASLQSGGNAIGGEECVWQVVQILTEKYGHRMNWNFRCIVDDSVPISFVAVHWPKLLLNLLQEKSIDLRATFQQGETLLSRFVSLPMSDTTQALSICKHLFVDASTMNSGAEHGVAPLMRVHPRHSLQLIAWLVDHGADPTSIAIHKDRQTVLYIFSTEKFYRTSNHRPAEVLEFLLKKGARKHVNTLVDGNDWRVAQPPLHGVLGVSKVGIGDTLEGVLVLIKHGADVRQKDGAGRNACEFVGVKSNVRSVLEAKLIQAVLKRVMGGETELVGRYLEEYPKLKLEEMSDHSVLAKILGTSIEEIAKLDNPPFAHTSDHYY